jgi:hypothetical protein
VAAARFFALLYPVPPTYYDCYRAPVLWPLLCRLSTDLLLFVFVHAGRAHVSLASRTSQRLTSAYLTFVHLLSVSCSTSTRRACLVSWLVTPPRRRGGGMRPGPGRGCALAAARWLNCGRCTTELPPSDQRVPIASAQRVPSESPHQHQLTPHAHTHSIAHSNAHSSAPGV